MKKLTTIIFTALALTSCNCVQQVDGIILDRETKEPIDGVIIKSKKGTKVQFSTQEEIISDNGRFKYYSKSSADSDCGTFDLSFSKEGYKTIDKTFDTNVSNDTTYIEKLK